ncbi:hypothetical protein BTM148_01390 [Helicobacter pylori]
MTFWATKSLMLGVKATHTISLTRNKPLIRGKSLKRSLFKEVTAKSSPLLVVTLKAFLWTNTTQKVSKAKKF